MSNHDDQLHDIIAGIFAFLVTAGLVLVLLGLESWAKGFGFYSMF